jgi:hypothetical protein
VRAAGKSRLNQAKHVISQVQAGTIAVATVTAAISYAFGISYLANTDISEIMAPERVIQSKLKNAKCP